MFGFLDSIFGWIFSTFFYFGLARIEDGVTWLLPIYVTVQVLRNTESKNYDGFLSFWCLASLLFGIDWLTGFMLHNILLYRLLRVVFLIWIFIDNGENSKLLVNRFLSPVIEQYRDQIESVFDLIDKYLNSITAIVGDRAKEKFSAVVPSQQDVAAQFLSFASSASQSVSSFVKTNTNSNSNGNSNNSDENSDNTTDSAGTSGTSSSSSASKDAVSAPTDVDSKDTEN